MKFRSRRGPQAGNSMIKLGVLAGVLGLAAYFGIHVSARWLGLILLGTGALLLVQWPVLGLLGFVAAALVVPMEFSTGSAVKLNLAVVLTLALLAIWFVSLLHRRDLRPRPSRANRPLALFLLAGLFSLLIGTVFWDPRVPWTASFIVVQVAQWALFGLSAGAFWLTGNLVADELWLRRLVFFFLALGGGLAILLVLPQIGILAGIVGRLANTLSTQALHRAPFWLLLAALPAGQLMFNRDLGGGWKALLIAVLGAVLIYAFHLMRKAVSTWVGVAAVLGVLTWLRWPRLRLLPVVLLLVLTSTGLLSSTVYDFAGGDDEWESSGGSRLALIGRVVEVTLRNPITGLGPAAYRPYAGMKPLQYEQALWLAPRVSSHNNYVDLFSHVGVLGLGLFLWFAVEVTRLGFRLRERLTEGFAAGYVNAMIAAWAGALMLMLFADWILPFVYNIGFPGFQASGLIWLFLGGLVSLDQMGVPREE